MLLRQLEYIIAVERFKSFTKAADYCCVTQPTLSQQIRTLENHLEIEIFDRSSLPITPTKKGKELLQKAREVLQQAVELKEMAKSMANKPACTSTNSHH